MNNLSTENVHNYFKLSDDKNVSDSRYYGNPRRVKSEEELDDITLEKLGLTVERVKLELLGMDEDLTLPNGNEYDESFYKQMLEMAVNLTEQEFDIVIRPHKVVEMLDYNRSDFNSYMFVRTKRKPVIQVEELQLNFDNQKIIRYPDEWLKVTHRYGQLEIQPTFMSQGFRGTVTSQTLGMGLMNGGNLNRMYGTGMGSNEFAPQMIGCTYYAGMLPKEKEGITEDWTIPPVVIAYIAKLSAIEVLERWGRLVLGAGIAGYSISIDGISSSVDSTQSAENTASTADIDLIKKDMKQLHDALQSYYGYNVGIIS